MIFTFRKVWKKLGKRVPASDIWPGKRIGSRPASSVIVFFNFLPGRDPLREVNNRTARFPEINVPFSRFLSAPREESPFTDKAIVPLRVYKQK